MLEISPLFSTEYISSTMTKQKNFTTKALLPAYRNTLICTQWDIHLPVCTCSQKGRWRRKSVLKSPDQHDLIITTKEKNKAYSRRFCRSWFKRNLWLTWSGIAHALLCFFWIYQHPLYSLLRNTKMPQSLINTLLICTDSADHNLAVKLSQELEYCIAFDAFPF